MAEYDIPPEGEQHQSDHGEEVWQEPELVTDEELDLLNDEVKVLHGNDLKEAANILLEEKAILAVQSIAKLARTANNDRIRLDASKYILERVLGPLSKMQLEIDEEETALGKLLKDAGFDQS